MRYNLPKIEKEILELWEEKNIFRKSILQRKGKKRFVFFEGPPFPNAKPGIHHLLARAFKDVILRYKTMEGFYVERRAGWDTHGLPIELAVEKRLKIKNKKDIEKVGIKKFIKECRENIFTFKKEWEDFTKRIGYWLDLKNPYITCDNNYIETLWWILKRIWEKGLLYQDYKVVPFCPRCQTSLSSHEVAQGYKKIKEKAITLKFELVREPKTFVLAWTTTPWTLPANVALAVNPNINYVKVSLKGSPENYILSKKAFEKFFKKEEVKILRKIKVKELIFKKYKPLYKNKAPYLIIEGDFVSDEEGTGIVHIAPAFGEEDMELIRKQKKVDFPLLMTVDEEGRMRTPGYKWNKLFVKKADSLIVEDLKKRNLIFKEELYEHDYPFCWRCDTPLLYYAKKSWFIKISKIKKKLIENNKKINWVPSYIKEGRFGRWLKEIKDWTLSRERYWGTPLPIWRCEGCQNLEFIGSRKDLLRQKFTTNEYYLLRHGESTKNKKKIEVCWPEKVKSPLTKKGRGQIEKILPILKRKKIDLIVSSDLLRTKETAEIISRKLKIKIIFDKRLREINFGIFNGKKSVEKEKFFDPERKLTPREILELKFKKRYPRGENYQDVQKRLYSLLLDLEKRYSKKRILLVSHCRPITFLEGLAKGMSRKELIEYMLSGKEIKKGELRKIKFRKFPWNDNFEMDFHRPFIDEIEFLCKKCGKKMKRVPEVIDVWFDSGAMPFASLHYPFENKKLIEKRIFFPADYICEGIDQTRGWFYTLLAISTLLGFGPPYKNVICHGLVLDEKGQKMSKSRGNVIFPEEILEKYGADLARFYFYTINPEGEFKRFSFKDLEDKKRRFFDTLFNSFNFLLLYLEKNFTFREKIPLTKNILNLWILSRIEELKRETRKNLDKFQIVKTARLFEEFLDDLSNWYIRRSRERFQNPKQKREKEEASQTLFYVLFNFLLLLAPFLPFTSEYLYRKISHFFAKKPKESIHLYDFPKFKKEMVDEKLETEMEKARKIISLILAERRKAKIKVRQPLSKLELPKKFTFKKEILEIMKQELNVKEIVFGKKIKLDKRITKELKEEGILREIIRSLQQLRKKKGLLPKDKIIIFCKGDKELERIIRKYEKEILERVKAKEISFLLEKETEILKIDKKEIKIKIKKI